MTAVPTHTGPRARHQQGLVVIGQVLALSCWFSASAVSADLRTVLGIGDQASVLLATAVQLGFVIGALGSALLNLADRVPAPVLYCVSSVTAAVCTALIALVVRDYATVVLLRLLTGVSLAGVYPVGMKLMASWATPATRARALGLLVGGLTLGSAMPLLIRGFHGLPWQGVLLTAAGLTGLGGLLVLLTVRLGPSVDGRRGTFAPGYVVTMFRHTKPRLANLGYLGHMWELYALWTWLPVFVLASQVRSGGTTGALVSVVSFAAIGLAGLVGCLAGGWAADRFGRAPAAVAALAVSGTCCLLSPLFFGASLPVLTVLLLVWGAAVIADSGVFSTALSESVDQQYVGTALTAQTAFGFLLTIVSIQLVSLLAGVVTWQYAFVVLALGPVVGARAMHRFGRTGTRPQPASSPSPGGT